MGGGSAVHERPERGSGGGGGVCLCVLCVRENRRGEGAVRVL